MIKQQMAQLMLSGGLATALWCSPAAAASANSTAPFAVAQRYVLSGTEHWDYVAYDAPRHHLFISRANHVQVVDTVTGKLFGEIKGTDGVHGFAFVPDKNLGFITNGRADTITVVNLDTLQVVDTIKASGADPDGILYVPLLQRIYVSNGHANSVSAIDIATRKVIATIAVGGKPEALRQSRRQKRNRRTRRESQHGPGTLAARVMRRALRTDHRQCHRAALHRLLQSAHAGT